MTTNLRLETYRRAFDLALNVLIERLKEAQDYLGSGTDRHDSAAIGTLQHVEEEFADVQAALRLFQNERRRA